MVQGRTFWAYLYGASLLFVLIFFNILASSTIVPPIHRGGEEYKGREELPCERNAGLEICPGLDDGAPRRPWPSHGTTQSQHFSSTVSCLKLHTRTHGPTHCSGGRTHLADLLKDVRIGYISLANRRAERAENLVEVTHRSLLGTSHFLVLFTKKNVRVPVFLRP